MLMKANGADEIDKALNTWRAMLPHWNLEADRIRTLIKSGLRVLTSEVELESLSESMRQTMAAAERHLLACPAGDARFVELLQVIGECDALLDSYQTSIERLEPQPERGAFVPVKHIAHPQGLAG